MKPIFTVLAHVTVYRSALKNRPEINPTFVGRLERVSRWGILNGADLGICRHITGCEEPPPAKCQVCGSS
jgi:hypothetical protein